MVFLFKKIYTSSCKLCFELFLKTWNWSSPWSLLIHWNFEGVCITTFLKLDAWKCNTIVISQWYECYCARAPQCSASILWYGLYIRNCQCNIFLCFRILSLSDSLYERSPVPEILEHDGFSLFPGFRRYVLPSMWKNCDKSVYEWGGC